MNSSSLDPSADAVPMDESTTVSKPTSETLMAGERIIEALDIAAQDLALIAANVGGEKAPAPRNPIFSMYGGIGAEEYVLKVVRSVQAAQLQDALLVLPFGKVVQLLECLDFWASKVSYSVKS